MSFINIQNVTYIYGAGTKAERKALDGVSLTVERGESVGLIGRTGSGKSTLIQHLNGLMKPSGGRVTVDGDDFNADKKLLRSARKKVGLVFQYPEHQLFEETVLKDVMFGPLNMGLNKDEAAEKAREALSLVGLDEGLFERSVFELSGGQKRRAAIAGVLAMEPECLVLDEPAAGLDPAGRDGVLRLIEDMRAARGATIIFVSHSMEDVARVAERVVALDDGKIVIDAPTGEAFADRRLLERIGLAAPEHVYLINALVAAGVCPEPPETIYTAEKAEEWIARNLPSGVEL